MNHLSCFANLLKTNVIKSFIEPKIALLIGSIISGGKVNFKVKNQKKYTMSHARSGILYHYVT